MRNDAATSRPARRINRVLAAALTVGIAAIAGLSLAQAEQPQVTFERVAPAKINQDHKARALRVGDATLKSWAAGRFTELSTDDFHPQLAKVLTPAKQREAYDIIRGTFGDYQSMAFTEAATSPQIPNIVVYRFRGTFSKNVPAEVRVVLDPEGKVAGFFCKNWSDTIQ